MRSFLFFISVFFAFAMVALSPHAYSQKNSNSCEKAKSTAESMDCINRRLQTAQSRLNDVYKQYAENASEPVRTAAGKAQQDWIAYRDAQCALEATLANPPSLARIHELSCMKALTEARTDMLASLIQAAGNTENPREFSARPRWMNVLAQDHPDVFWHYGSIMRADLNCDGTEEEIMSGLKVSPRIEAMDKADISFSGKIIIAAVDNPPAGKPKARLLDIPLATESSAPHLCATSIHLSSANTPESGHGAPQACETALKISDSVCVPVLLYWDGKEYKLKPSQTLSTAEIQ